MLLLYCRRCHKELENYGIVAEVVYEHICEWHALKNEPVIMTQRELNGLCCRKPVVDFLERKGFLMTTEVGKGRIAIKPSNFKEVGDIKMYCRGHK